MSIHPPKTQICNSSSHLIWNWKRNKWAVHHRNLFFLLMQEMMSCYSSQSIRYVAREARKASNIFIFPSLFKKSFHCSNSQFVVINLCSASEEKYQIKPLPCLTFTQKETEFLGSDITNTLPANTIIFQMRISQFVKHMKSQCGKKKKE